MSLNSIFFAVTIPCGAIASGLFFWILARMHRLGHQRSGWPGRDFRLYAIYWHIAPEKGWSRWLLIAAVAFFLFGCGALFFAK